MGLTATIERGAHLIASHLEPVLQGLSITQGEAHVLVQLKDGPTAINKLHHEFGHKRSTLTNILDRLEARDLVRREANTEDRRSLVVRLTAAGARTASRVAEVLDRLEHELARNVGASDLHAAEAVVDALETIVRSPTPSPRTPVRRSTTRKEPTT